MICGSEDSPPLLHRLFAEYCLFSVESQAGSSLFRASRLRPNFSPKGMIHDWAFRQASNRTWDKVLSQTVYPLNIVQGCSFSRTLSVVQPPNALCRRNIA